VWQLRGQAGERQVEGAKVALQHNLGLGGACVVTMYRTPAPQHKLGLAAPASSRCIAATDLPPNITPRTPGPRALSAAVGEFLGVRDGEFAVHCKKMGSKEPVLTKNGVSRAWRTRSALSRRSGMRRLTLRRNLGLGGACVITSTRGD
jgi:hypothetical protein